MSAYMSEKIIIFYLGTLCLGVWSWRGTRGEAVQIVDWLLDRDLSSLIELEIQLSGTQTVPTKWWRKLFNRTPELRVLSLQSTRRMICALKALQGVAPTASRKSRYKVIDTSRSTSPESPNASAIPLPHLKELFLCDRNFTGICSVDLDYQKECLEDSSSPLHYLVKYLETRKARGFCLEQLSLNTRTRVDAPPLKFLTGLGLVQQITVHDLPLDSDLPLLFLLHSKFTWNWKLH
jgi:hypothetical protein